MVIFVCLFPSLRVFFLFVLILLPQNGYPVYSVRPSWFYPSHESAVLVLPYQYHVIVPMDLLLRRAPGLHRRITQASSLAGQWVEQAIGRTSERAAALVIKFLAGGSPDELGFACDGLDAVTFAEEVFDMACR